MLPPSARLILLLLPIAACSSGATQRADGELVVDSGYVVTDDSVRLFYRTVGTGATDIIIPLGFLLEESFVRLAAPDRRLVFFDPRARGRSEAGDRSRVTLDRQVEDVDAIRDALGIDSMVVIAWSGLAMEAAVYALRHPTRVTRFVQIAPVAPRDEPHNAAAYRARAVRTDTAALTAVRERRRSGDLAGDEAGYCRALRAITSPPSFASPDSLRAVPDPCRFANEYPDSLALVFRPLLESFRGYDWRPDLPRLTMPRLVIHGRQDAFPLEGTREWTPDGANARLLVLDEAGHYPSFERPDAFFSAVEVFLRGEWPRQVQP